jgi:hypothetical protein
MIWTSIVGFNAFRSGGPGRQRLQLVEGEQGGASVGCSAAADSAPATRVQGGGHPEMQAASPVDNVLIPELTGSVDRVALIGR